MNVKYFIKGLPAILLGLIWAQAFGQHPADNYTVVSLCNLDLNRTATKLSTTELATVAPAAVGYKWNSSDASTLRWRPQGITGFDASCKQFSMVSWYGRHINNPFPFNGSNADYRNRGSRVSFVDITDMDSIRYRHVLLVDENYNTFYDMHAGGLAMVNDTLYAPDSRGGTDAMYAFDLKNIKEVPPGDQSTYYNYKYILQKLPSPTDSLPINPSFVSYDRDDQQLMVGSFSNCGSPFCTNGSVNRMMWYNPGNANPNTPFYDGFFGRMQGAASRNAINQPTKKDIWVSRSYGSGNNSKLYALNLDMGNNTMQGQSINIGNNYATFTLPPGLEDLYLSPGNDTLWSCTEFSPQHPVASPVSSNRRYVFGIPTASALPPGTCLADVNYAQDTLSNDTICNVSPRTYRASTDYVAYASFDKSDQTWIEVNGLRDSLASSNRSAFMWIKQSTTVSSSSQMLFAINTASGGNICNLQIGTNEFLGIYDGDNSHYGATAVTDGEWHHVGYTYEESSGLTQLYLDGALEATYTNAQSATSSSLFSIGQEFDSGLSKGNFFEGEMTEVSIWNEVLSTSDIALLMASTINNAHPKKNRLMAYYPMNKECGDDLTVVEDISGNGRDGRAYGSIGTSGIDVQSVSSLEQIPGFNSAAYYSKDWLENNVSISTSDSLVLTSYANGSYSLVLSRGPFQIVDDWNIVMAIAPTNMTQGLCANDSLLVNGTYYHAGHLSGLEVFTNVGPNGCDSIVHVSLTSIQTSTGTDTQSACNSFTWIDGNTYNSSNNTATHTLTNAAGCDSVITLDLTISQSSSTTDTQSACNSFTWIDGNTYNSSNNTATHTLTNAVGCDSVITLDLTISQSSSTTDTQSACNSFTWIDGNTYNSSNNTATHTLTNAAGCDSVVTLDLTINQSSSTTDTQSACNSFTWIDGNTYNSSNNTATHTLTNAAGCDSVVTLDLTINNVNVATSSAGVSITATASGAQYQWLDCNNGNAIISGATSQTFTPTTSGDYAVEVTQNGCTDTSACVNVTVVARDMAIDESVYLYPNPAERLVHVDLAGYTDVSIKVFNLSGQKIYQQDHIHSTVHQFELEGPPGVYLVEVTSPSIQHRMKLVKR